MRAIILAAGLGTRLFPLTKDKPKALVEVAGKPLLQHAIEKLKGEGFIDIIINIHHFADDIISFINANDSFGINIQFSDERDELLETGGGIQKAKWFLSQSKDFLVYNVDIISDIDLGKFSDFHKSHEGLASLAVRNRETSRSLLINDENTLSGWKNNLTNEVKISRGNEEMLSPIAFSAIYILNSNIFDLMTETGKFSIIETFLRLAKHHELKVYHHDKDFWLDLGRIEQLKLADNFLKSLS